MQHLFNQTIYVRKIIKTFINQFGEAETAISLLGPYKARVEQLRVKPSQDFTDQGILDKAEFIVYVDPSLSIVENDEILDHNQNLIGYVIAVVQALSYNETDLHHVELYLSKKKI